MTDSRAKWYVDSPNQPLLRPGGWAGFALTSLLDITLAVMLVLSLLGIQLIVAFHMAFAAMTLMAFTHRTPGYLLRVVPGTLVVTLAVAISVQNETSDIDELYEIPIMALMLASVFLAARLIGRLIGELDSQQSRLRNLHAASQIELKEQLFMSQRLATHGRLSAGIAHNFRNTMTAILSLAERIEYTAEDPAVVHAATRIQSQADDAAQLLRGMLNVSTTTTETNESDLVSTLHDERAILGLLAGPDVDIVFEVDEGPLLVPVSRAQVTHILLNLVMNANDAVPGTGLIAVGARRDGDSVRLWVTDDGVGMDEETIARAFEPFFTTKSSGEGSGLGLYMVRTIVEDAGGSVSVRSEPHTGTTIEIELPTVSTDLPPRVTESLEVRPERYFGTETIVVAEDDPVIREQLVWVLDMFGYDVHQAADGEAALEILAELSGVSLVVSDVVMPRCSGPDLQIRLRDRGRNIPFLYTSAYDTDSEARQRVPDDADLLIKPFGRTQLLSRVRAALD